MSESTASSLEKEISALGDTVRRGLSPWHIELLQREQRSSLSELSLREQDALRKAFEFVAGTASDVRARAAKQLLEWTAATVALESFDEPFDGREVVECFEGLPPARRFYAACVLLFRFAEVQLKIQGPPSPLEPTQTPR